MARAIGFLLTKSVFESMVSAIHKMNISSIILFELVGQ
jgi:hypothetical protein